MAIPDYCCTLLKKSNTKKACLCIHHNTSTDFGGWSNCANASVPRGRHHVAKNKYLNDSNSCGGISQEGGLSQKANAKPAPKLPVFRKKDKKSEEPECLRFCHLEDTSDHARNYRERKNGLYVEKIPNKMGPPFRLLQLKSDVQHSCYHGFDEGIGFDMSQGSRYDSSRIRKNSNFLPLIIYNSNINSDNERESPILSQHAGQLLTLNEANSSQLLGKAVLFYSDIDVLTRRNSKGYRGEGIGAATQMSVYEPVMDFATCTWVPENAIYQTRRSSSTMYNSTGCLASNKSIDSQASSSFQPLHLHTNHLRKCKYPPSSLVREKQDDVVMVRNSRNKDGKVRTKVEYLTMTAPEKESAVIKKRVRYLDPLPIESEATGGSHNGKGNDYHGQDNFQIDNAEQRRLYSGRLLYGRMRSGTQRVVVEDIQRLAIGKQQDSGEDKQTHSRSKGSGKTKTKKKFYQVEKHDSSQSIPSKSKARACDLQILPSPSSSAAALQSDSKSDSNVSPSTSAQLLARGDSKKGRYVEDGQPTNFTVEICDRESDNVIVNCPTVIDSTLLATPHRSQKQGERVTSSVLSKHRHSYPSLRKSADPRRSAGLHNQSTKTSNKLAAKQLNQILLNSSTEKFLPSSNLHGRIKFSHTHTGRKESGNSTTGYRVTLGGSSSAEILDEQVKGSSRCMLRSRQRRRVQLQKNILGKAGAKIADHKSMMRSYRKAAQPVRVCLRGTQKKLIDFLRTSSASSIDNNSCNLSELYAE